MPQYTDIESIRGRVLIRIDTLVRLRWLAIAGQSIAVFVVAFGVGFPMPWGICLALIAFSVVFNLVLSQRYKSNHRLAGGGVFALLAFDILQLGLLLFLTGGLQNPFAILLMAPVVVSATSLNLNHTLVLGALAAGFATVLVFFHLPLPWFPGEQFELPLIFVGGVWFAINCTLGFTAIYSFRVAEEARKLADALSATELVLQREQHLSVLDGLAAAAAHELGTPLATIALVAKEMVNTFPDESPLREDAQLLRSQAERCREILQKLTSLSSDGDAIFESQTLAVLVEEAVAPLRDFGVKVTINQVGDTNNPPTTTRSPAVQYGLGNIIDNAVDFAASDVSVEMSWTDELVSIDVFDDGPGFNSEILDHLGDPFVTTRKSGGVHDHGLGLGLFIAKTLLERNGAEMEFSNISRTDFPSPNRPSKGAHVAIVWTRKDFESTAPPS